MSLPKGSARRSSDRVAEGDKAAAAKAAGADEVGAAELAEKIQGGWTDFDIVITSPDMMKHVGKLGKTLGPQGKMPSPKSGTVTPDVAAAVKEFKAGKVEFRTDGRQRPRALGKRSSRGRPARQSPAFLTDHVRACGRRPPRATSSARSIPPDGSWRPHRLGGRPCLPRNPSFERALGSSSVRPTALSSSRSRMTVKAETLRTRWPPRASRAQLRNALARRARGRGIEIAEGVLVGNPALAGRRGGAHAAKSPAGPRKKSGVKSVAACSTTWLSDKDAAGWPGPRRRRSRALLAASPVRVGLVATRNGLPGGLARLLDARARWSETQGGARCQSGEAP